MTEKTTRTDSISAQSTPRTVQPGPYRQFFRRFLRQRLAVFCLGVVVVEAVVALLWSAEPLQPQALVAYTTRHPVLSIPTRLLNPVRSFPYPPSQTFLKEQLQPPSSRHLLGTDQLGRDTLSRMLHGTRISLTVGMVAVGIAVTIGIVIGAVAGYTGGWTDVVLMRFVDIMMNFPVLFLIITVIALIGKPSFWWVIFVLGVTGWTGTARFVRAEFLSLRDQDFVLAVRATGAGPMRIMFKHILPNAVAPVLVSASLSVAGFILTEAGLSFLGFGVQPPQATWGNILTEGRNYILDGWWLFVFPGIAILITVLAFNLVGEGLRDALNPKLAEGTR